MKEIITFIILFILSAFLFWSLSRLTKWFAHIEIVLLFIFTSYICQSMFYTFSSSLYTLQIVEEHVPFWTVRLQYGVIFAITLLWVLAIYRSNTSLLKKLFATFSWMLFGILVERTFLELGILYAHSKSWHPSIDLFSEMIVLLVTLWFSDFLQRTLRTESII